MTIVIADGRGALWQWDTGRRVKIVGGAGVKQIHYQNNCFDRSVDVDVEDDGTAIIPDELLQDYHRLTAYAYVTDDTGAYTMVQQDFPVYKRAKPADYVFTPVEQTTIAEIAAIAQSVRDDADAGRFDGITPSIGDNGNWYLGTTDTGKPSRGATGAKGDPGSKGDPGIAGQDGHSPVVTATKSGKTTTISVDGTAIATVEDGADGGSVPKPLTYDYMPEGYPSKSVQTTTLMEEQELAFALMEDPIYGVVLQSPIEIVVSQTCTVKWDGTEYECVCVVSEIGTAFGNLSIMGSGDDTGEPFLYVYNTNRASGLFGTLDTSASHTISVKTTVETVTPMAEEFLPATLKNTTVFYT